MKCHIAQAGIRINGGVTNAQKHAKSWIACKNQYKCISFSAKDATHLPSVVRVCTSISREYTAASFSCTSIWKENMSVSSFICP